jgi:ADP-ribose pyrophosphatase
MEKNLEFLNEKKGQSDKWGCGCAVINSDGKLLLGLRCKKTDLPQWSFVGGSIETGESPFEGIKREIKEESDLTPLVVQYVDDYEKDGVRDFLFICKFFTGKPFPQEGEFSKIGFFTLEEIEGMELFSYTIESLNILKDKGYVK